MNINSPVYGWKGNQAGLRKEEDFRSPFTSPQNTSPGFSPYSYSSPKKPQRGGPKRYFNPNSPSPYKHQHNRKNGGKGSTEPAHISMYYDPTATENPWADLEKEYKESRLSHSPISSAPQLKPKEV